MYPFPPQAGFHGQYAGGGAGGAGAAGSAGAGAGSTAAGNFYGVSCFFSLFFFSFSLRSMFIASRAGG